MLGSLARARSTRRHAKRGRDVRTCAVERTFSVRRLRAIELQPGAEIAFHSTFNRAPLSVPSTFTPGSRNQS
jgi:hypothetical protein